MAGLGSSHIMKLNEHELRSGATDETSWHSSFKDSSYIFIGGLDNRLTEGDIITVFSQWGQPIDVFVTRDSETGESKGFCFLCYEDQRSTNLAVDNANGMTLLEKKIKVSHVRFRPPQEDDENGNPKEYKASGPEGQGLNMVSKAFLR